MESTGHTLDLTIRCISMYIKKEFPSQVTAVPFSPYFVKSVLSLSLSYPINLTHRWWPPFPIHSQTMYPSLPSSQHQTLYTEPNLKPEGFLAWGSKVVKISGSIDHNQDQTTPTWSPRAPLKDPWSGLSLSSFPRPHIKIKQMIIPHQWITPKTQKDLDDGPDGTHSSQVHNHRGRPWVYHRIYGPDLASGVHLGPTIQPQCKRIWNHPVLHSFDGVWVASNSTRSCLQ